MKTLMVLASVLVAACAASLSSDVISAHWHGFKAKHGKAYESPAEEQHRMNVFADNLQRVNEHNARFSKGLETFKVAVNEYSDLLNDEMDERYNGLRIDATKVVREGGRVYFADPKSLTTPKSIDWRRTGHVTDVKNQGHCGSCWAFSATGALEAQLFRKTGKLVSLSEQHLVDCSAAYGNNGCNGGLMDNAFGYIQDNKGIQTEDSYPYEAKEGKCRYNAQHNAGTVTGYVKVNPTEKDLQDAISKVGPVSVGIYAGNWGFKHYESGIYYERNCSSTMLNHGVLAVGYGSEGMLFPKDYWIVKNSWGKDWGEGGYVRIARNRHNQCGVATMASFPTV